MMSRILPTGRPLVNPSVRQLSPIMGVDIVIPAAWQKSCVLYANPAIVSGRLMDCSDYQNHGIITGARYQSGQAGMVLKADGLDDYALFPPIKAYDVDTGITMAYWTNVFGGLAGARGISKAYNGLTANYACYALCLNAFTPRIYLPGSGGNLYGSGVINGKGWHFIAGSYSAITGRIALFKNRAVNAEGVGSGSIRINPNTPISLMANYWEGNTDFLLTGLMGEAWVFNAPLPDVEIFKLYDSTAWKYGVAA